MLIVTLFSLIVTKKVPQDSGVDSGVVTDDGEAKANNQVDYL